MINDESSTAWWREGLPHHGVARSWGGFWLLEPRSISRVQNRSLLMAGSGLECSRTALVSLVYTVAAGMVVSLCEGMKWIAYRGQPARWSDSSRIILGAVWPLTLMCCAIVYTFLAVIHRLF